jgi:hypothetical protein
VRDHFTLASTLESELAFQADITKQVLEEIRKLLDSPQDLHAACEPMKLENVRNSKMTCCLSQPARLVRIAQLGLIHCPM